MKFSDLASLSTGKLVQLQQDREIVSLEVDSRKALVTEGTLFIAISGIRHDGHLFVKELYDKGVRLFVIEKPISLEGLEEANFFLVHSGIQCLQDIAAYHRSIFHIPVVGVTGSNGKTIIKEWLYQLLSPDYHIAKNPGSYNSQTGVPLSVWGIRPNHTLAILEAGISTVGEMEKLAKIIRPTIGIFTNLGPAHNEGFANIEQKLEEKINLFESANVIIYSKDQTIVDQALEKRYRHKLFSWGIHPGSDVRIQYRDGQEISFSTKGRNFSIDIPFGDPASRENALHCIALMLYLGYDPAAIGERIAQLKSVPMRLELKQGINHCQIIDDTYNNDLAGLQISLNFLAGMKKRKNTLILSDLLQSGSRDEEWVGRIAEALNKSVVTHFIGIGPGLTAHQARIGRMISTQFFSTPEEFLARCDWDQFQNEMILVKGARTFRFERIVQKLQKKIHGTVMEIDLSAIVHNLNYFRSSLKPGVKLMIMVKAFAYGSGSEEVTHLLQYHKVDYLGVAYPDEGVELRKSHIQLPIMVMNPSEESFSTLLEHQLEPEIFSLALLRSLVNFLDGRPCGIHFKLDTGMHRLGIEEAELGEAIAELKSHTNIRVVSVFSHLAGADESMHDPFTRDQAKLFTALSEKIKKELGINPMLHLLNSSGIIRFPDLQFDMVRLGIGLYGVNPTGEKISKLKPVATLKTVISQIKKIRVGETVGYGRKGKTTAETVLATMAIGYADGYSRSFSNGVGEVLIHGRKAPVIGNVCMDMTMINITGIDAREGDEVIIFGPELPIQQIASRIKTIPYEILTSINERVKRIFFTESI